MCNHWLHIEVNEERKARLATQGARKRLRSTSEGPSTVRELEMSTTEYQIEREIVIDAPVEVVWRTITEPDQISLWFADKVELEIKPGAHGYPGLR